MDAREANAAHKTLKPKEHAALVKDALREAFPGHKFWVKTEKASPYACMRVYWVDGPTVKVARGVVEHLAGGDFDGMTDYQTTNVHYDKLKHEDVVFGCGFIFFERHPSETTVRNTIHDVWVEAKLQKQNKPTVVAKPCHFSKAIDLYSAKLDVDLHVAQYDLPITQTINKRARDRDLGVVAQFSTTARRFALKRSF